MDKRVEIEIATLLKSTQCSHMVDEYMKVHAFKRAKEMWNKI